MKKRRFGHEGTHLCPSVYSKEGSGTSDQTYINSCSDVLGDHKEWDGTFFQCDCYSRGVVDAIFGKAMKTPADSIYEKACKLYPPHEMLRAMLARTPLIIEGKTYQYATIRRGEDHFLEFVEITNNEES